VVRPSGTEPVLRITVEARDDATAKRIVESLAAEAMETLA
jgi:phosphomannomutase